MELALECMVTFTFWLLLKSRFHRMWLLLKETFSSSFSSSVYIRQFSKSSLFYGLPNRYGRLYKGVVVLLCKLAVGCRLIALWHSRVASCFTDSPVPKDAVLRDPLPMRDTTMFKSATRVPRVLHTDVHVPHGLVAMHCGCVLFSLAAGLSTRPHL